MLPARSLRRAQAEPTALHDRAMDNLRFIRETMERSTSFTAVSGVAGVAMGIVALAAAALAGRQETPIGWLSTWLGAALISGVIAVWAMALKARTSGMSLLRGPGRKFVLFFSPPIAVGGLLTVELFRSGLPEALPGTWLLLYGTAVVTGGAYSVRSVPLMGAAFMVVGACALLSPATWGDAYMAVGFGVLHIAFGVVIWRKHGG